MSTRGTNPSDPSQLTLHLAYAEASVMIIESLLQMLIDAKALPLDAIIENLEQAIATKRELIADGSHPEVSRVAAGVLSGLANSLAAGQTRAVQAIVPDPLPKQ
jgi:hypothetical protein